MMNRKQICALKGLAHPLSPAVQLGKSGYSPAFVSEVARHLTDHELIKVRLGADDRSEFKTMAGQLATDTTATLITTVGRIAVLYKPGKLNKIKV